VLIRELLDLLPILRSAKRRRFPSAPFPDPAIEVGLD
jgi:hypothetical protein